jgi:hypothetical protein
MTEEQRKDSQLGRVLRILGFVALGGCVMVTLCVGGFVYVLYRTTQPVADVGSAFLEATAEEDFNRAFSLLSDGYQTEFGGPEALGAFLREEGIDPARWSFNSRSVEDEVGEISSNVIMADGSERNVTIRLSWTGTLWLITNISFE